MGAALEEKRDGKLEIGNACCTGQGRLPIVTLHCCAHVIERLLSLNKPRCHPRMAGGESLQALLRDRRVSRHRLQEGDTLQFLVFEFLLLGEREGGGALSQHDRKGGERFQESLSGLVLSCAPKLDDCLTVAGQCAFEVAARLLKLRLEARHMKPLQWAGVLGELL